MDPGVRRDLRVDLHPEGVAVAPDRRVVIWGWAPDGRLGDRDQAVGKPDRHVDDRRRAVPRQQLARRGARIVRNKRLGQVGYLWALSLLTTSPGARAHYDRRRERVDNYSAAARNLANRRKTVRPGLRRSSG